MLNLVLLGRLGLALLLGFILGWQREKWGKSAGSRTYALVSMGSALFTILSFNAFGPNTAQVAGQIVTGIGFLGAGVILHKEDKVEGLTTAAGLWLVAAIGMASALGYYSIAIAVSVLALFTFLFTEDKVKKML